MAFLNAAEREALLNELKKMNFKQAKNKLQRMDPKGRLAVYRNVQQPGRWLTRFDLHGLGTRVTLVENKTTYSVAGKTKADFELVEVVVEPTAENRT